MKTLTTVEIESALLEFPNWTLGQTQLERTIEFGTYLEGPKFALDVGQIAERLNHHPDVHIYWKKVVIHTSTHSENGITKNDLELAGEIEKLIR